MAARVDLAQCIIGVIIIALTRNFLNLARIEIFWQGFATGAIILGGCSPAIR